MRAGDFLANPLNWRIHPDFQQQALSGVLDEVGWIDEVTVNQRTGRVVDGHLRVTLALRVGEDEPVPYRSVDLSEEEEAEVLATKDPIAALAGSDPDQFAEVLERFNTGDAALQQMLEEMSYDQEMRALLAGDDAEPHVVLGDPKKQIAVILFIDQVATLEQAIQFADIENRGKAITAICQAYIDAQG